MNKRLELRNRVWLKFHKHCAYCGNTIEIKDMQIDHLWPQHNPGLAEHYGGMDVESFENLMPSCRSCNHYKRGDVLETFRRSMKTLHKRIAKIYIVNVAINFGMLKITPFDGEFYFERCKSKK